MKRFVFFIAILLFFSPFIYAQSHVDNEDTTTVPPGLGTIVVPNPDPARDYSVTVGTASAPNLFHGFDAFTVDAGDSLTFDVTTSGATYVLCRVNDQSGEGFNLTADLSAPYSIDTNDNASFLVIAPNGIDFGGGSTANPIGTHITSATFASTYSVYLANGGWMHADWGQESGLDGSSPEYVGSETVGGNNGAVTIGSNTTLTVYDRLTFYGATITIGNSSLFNANRIYLGADSEKNFYIETGEFETGVSSDAGSNITVNGTAANIVRFSLQDTGAGANIEFGARGYNVTLTYTVIDSNLAYTGGGSAVLSVTNDLIMNNSTIDISNSLDDGDGGYVQIARNYDGTNGDLYNPANSVALDTSIIDVSALGDAIGNDVYGGEVEIYTQTFSMSGGSYIHATANGNAVDYEIQGGEVYIASSYDYNSTTNNESFTAATSVTLNGSNIDISTNGSNDWDIEGGYVEIYAQTFSMTNGSYIHANANGSNDGDDEYIDGGEVYIAGGYTYVNNTDDETYTAATTVTLGGSNIDVSANAVNNDTDDGEVQAGEVYIYTTTLNMTDSDINATANGVNNSGDYGDMEGGYVLISGTTVYNDNNNTELYAPVTTVTLNNSNIDVSADGDNNSADGDVYGGEVFICATTLNMSNNSSIRATANGDNNTDEGYMYGGEVFIAGGYEYDNGTDIYTPATTVSLDNSNIDVSANGDNNSNDGEMYAGNVEIYTRTLTMTDSSISATANGASNEYQYGGRVLIAGGNDDYDVFTPATTVTLDNSTIDVSSTGYDGYAGGAVDNEDGGIYIYTQTLIMTNNSSLLATNDDYGYGGRVQISGEYDDGSGVISPSTTVSLDNSTIDVSADGDYGWAGGATSNEDGGIYIYTQTLTMTNNSSLIASAYYATDNTDDERGGRVQISGGYDGSSVVSPATNVSLDNSTIDISTDGDYGLAGGAIGNENGGIYIVTQNLTMTNGSSLLATASGINGGGGRVGIGGGYDLGTGAATSATTVSLDDSYIEVSANNDDGTAGRVEIYTQTLSMTNGSYINGTANGIRGTGGDVLIAGGFDGASTYTYATTVSLDNSSIDVSATYDGADTATAGTVNILTQDFNMTNGSFIHADGTGANGLGGLVNIDATGTLTITDSDLSSQGTDGLMLIYAAGGTITNSDLTSYDMEFHVADNGILLVAGNDDANAGTVDVYIHATHQFDLWGALASGNGMRLESPTININDTGALISSGLLVGDVWNYGFVAPHNAVTNDKFATLNIQGNYHQTANGTLQTDVTPSQNDLLAVTGNANLDGTLDIQHSGTFHAGAKYTIITAANVNGKFDTLENKQITPRLYFEALYLNDEVQLIVRRQPFSRYFESDDPRIIPLIESLDKIMDNLPDDLEHVLASMDFMNYDELQRALGQLHSEPYDAFKFVAFKNTGAFVDTMFRYWVDEKSAPEDSAEYSFRHRSKKEHPLAYCSWEDPSESPRAYNPTSAADEDSEPIGLKLFVNFIGGYGDQDDVAKERTGFDFYTLGFIAGGEYSIIPELAIGIHSGYSNSHIDFKDVGGSDGNIDSFYIGPHARVAIEDFYAHLMLGYNHNEFEMNRNIEFGSIDRTASGHFSGDAFYASMGLGYDFRPGVFRVGPIAAIDYVYQTIGDVKEGGAGDIDLRIDNRWAHSLRTSLGARAAAYADLGSDVFFVPEIRAQWIHEFLDDDDYLHTTLRGNPNNPFDVPTADTVRDRARIAAIMSLLIQSSVNISVEYNLELHEEFYFHQGRFTLEFKF